MHSVLGWRKQWKKQYIAIGKTDLFYNSMGLCGNFTEKFTRWHNNIQNSLKLVHINIDSFWCFICARLIHIKCVSVKPIVDVQNDSLISFLRLWKIFSLSFYTWRKIFAPSLMNASNIVLLQSKDLIRRKKETLKS